MNKNFTHTYKETTAKELPGVSKGQKMMRIKLVKGDDRYNIAADKINSESDQKI